MEFNRDCNLISQGRPKIIRYNTRTRLSYVASRTPSNAYGDGWEHSYTFHNRTREKIYFWKSHGGSGGVQPLNRHHPFLTGLLRHCVHGITTSTRAADSCRGRQKSMCAVTKQAWPETHVCRPVLAPLPGPSHTTRPPSVTHPPPAYHTSKGATERRGGKGRRKNRPHAVFFFFLINMYRLWRCRQGVKFAANGTAARIRVCYTERFRWRRFLWSERARPPSADTTTVCVRERKPLGGLGKLVEASIGNVN